MSRAAELLSKCASPAELDGRPALTVTAGLSMLAALDTLETDAPRCPVCGRLSPCIRHEIAREHGR